MSDTETTRTVITEYYAAMGSGNRERLLELLAPDCHWAPPVSAPIAPVTGAAGIADALGRDVVKTMFDMKKPFNLEVQRMMVDGAFAVVQQRLTATAKATGLPYDNLYCWIYEVRDGRIVAMDEYADTLVAARTMGWLEGA